jgi:hypothetical protein
MAQRTSSGNLVLVLLDLRVRSILLERDDVVYPSTEIQPPIYFDEQ